MDRYTDPVINLAYRFLGTQHDAEDAAQDVFLRLYLHPPDLASGTKLFTWLYRVTVNRCFDLLRGRARRPQTLSFDASSEESDLDGLSLAERLPAPFARIPRDQVAESETAAATRRAVSTLPFRLRAPLLLAVFEQLSHEEIGRVLKISPKAVERRIARARDILKTRLAPHL